MVGMIEMSDDNKNNELSFKGKNVLITGSSRGLGFDYARYLASLGANVIINGVNEKNVRAAVNEIKRLSPDISVMGITLPVSEGEEIVQQVLEDFAQIDVLINNAGIVRDATFKNMTFDQWDEVYRTHLEGAFRITKAIWRHFLENKSGKILMTTSEAGLHGNFGQTNYSAMKAGLIGFCKALAVEGAKLNIQVNVIAPCANTDMNRDLIGDELREFMTVDKVSPVAAYLCHEDCKDTGQIVNVGAGWIAKTRFEYSEYCFDIRDQFNIQDVQKVWSELSSFEGNTSHPNDLSYAIRAMVSNIRRSSETMAS